VERVVVSGVNRAQMRAGTGAATSTATNGSADFSGPTLVRARFGATASRIDVDGVAGASASITPATSTGNIKIGCSLSGGSAFEGVVNAIIVTPPLSGADETNMYAWANARLA
jgi:hypothetical protein